MSANCRAVNVNIFRNLSADAECKIVNGGSRESDGSRYDRKVIFFDHNSIVSIETPQDNAARGRVEACSVARANIPGRMVDTMASNGRLYIATDSGALVTVTRVNSIYEILNSSYQRYNWISDVQLDGTGITLVGGVGKSRVVRFSLDEMTARVNDPLRSICLAGCRR